MKKIKVLLFLFLVIFLIFSKPVQSFGQTERAVLLRRIEILNHEIQLVRLLISNLQKNQQISSPSYIAIDLSSDPSILLEKNSNQAYPIASITKLMGAVIVQENIEKNRTITLNQKMLEPLGQSPCLYLGLNITAEKLLKASLIQSTNDASESLAYFLVGDESSLHLPPSSASTRSAKDEFLELMNQKARELGMKNTVFFDVHGLSSSNRSTSSDLAKLIAYIYEKHPEILAITRDNDFWLPNAQGDLLKFQNVNNFYHWSRFIGGKTGYLPQSRQTLAAVFQVNQKPVALILLYSNNRQADVFTILKRLGK